MTNPAGSSRRGNGVLALLLAVLFLAVLGASVGYLAGRQVLAHRDLATGQDQDGGSTTNPPTGGASTASGGTHCPSVSEKTAKKELFQVRYIETNRSEAWICRDAGNGLWYQGHNKDGDIDSNDFSILIEGAQDNGDGSYVATNKDHNGTTRYFVYTNKLVIEVNGQKREPEIATSSVPG
jgi:hypothetical protein